MDKDEQQIVGLLQKKGLQAREFKKKEKDKSKTPDFRVFKDKKLIFFCEVKSIARDDWMERSVAGAPPGRIVIRGGDDPRFNRISNKIHEAIKQFEAVNPNSEYPNVLAFMNHDDMCGWLDLYGVVTGNFLAEGGKKYKIYDKYSEGRLKGEKFKIHLYIWKDEFKEERYFFNMAKEKDLKKLCNYFSKDPEDIRIL